MDIYITNFSKQETHLAFGTAEKYSVLFHWDLHYNIISIRIYVIFTLTLKNYLHYNLLLLRFMFWCNYVTTYLYYNAISIVISVILSRFMLQHYLPRVPTAPGKMRKAFPVMEISWNFEILQIIMEKWEETWKMRISVHSSQVFSLQNVIFFRWYVHWK